MASTNHVVFDARQCHAVASFLPRSVVQWIAEKPYNDGAEVEEFQGVLMLIDISGFTKMSEKLSDSGPAGLETITKHLNSFFGQLIDVVDSHGGDVVKIAGDALLVTWKVDNKTTKRRPSLKQRRATLSVGDAGFVDRYVSDSVANAVIHASVCAMSCVDLYRSYDIEGPAGKKKSASTTTETGQLRLHCALVCGKMFAVRCGGVEDAWDYLVCGDQIFENLRVALGKSKPGQVVVDKLARSHINLWIDMNPAYSMTFQDYPDCKDVYLITSMSPNFTENTQAVGNVDGHRGEFRLSLSQIYENDSLRPDKKTESSITSKKLQTWINLLQLRSNDIATLKKYLPPLIRNRLEEGQYECIPELRRCCILFVGIDSLHFQSVESVSPMQQAFNCIQSVTYRLDGFIRQFIMDDKGCVAIVVFGAPSQAHDDDPSRAVETALLIHSNLAELGIESSIGCTHGRVYFGDVGSRARREFALVGDVVNLAAHLMSKKLGILVEERLYDLSRSTIDFVKVDPVKVKGKDALVNVYKPTGVQRPTVSNFDPETSEQGKDEAKHSSRMNVTKLIGRENEISVVQACIQRLSEIKASCHRNLKLMMDSSTANTRSLIVCGDHGMGKSMICDYAATTSTQLGFQTIVNKNGYSDSSTAYRSWILMLESLLFNSPTMAKEQKQSTLKSHLSSVSLLSYQANDGDSPASVNLVQYAHLLYPLFRIGSSEPSESPEKQEGDSQYIRVMLKHLFLVESLPYPRVAVLEDIERMDSASLDLLVSIAKAGFPIMFILSYHATTKDTRLAQINQLLETNCGIEELYLAPLDQRGTLQLTRAYLGVTTIPEDVELLILDRTQGNPFIIGELCSSLLEKGLIIKNAEGQSMIDQLPNGELPVPDSIEAMVVQRIDKLGPQAMMALKVGSVFGMCFFIHDIADVYPLQIEKSDLSKYLMKCVRNQLLDRSPSSGQFEFRSRVIHDTAYNMLLVTQRQRLHLKIANRIETAQKRYINAIYPTLASHYSLADNFSKAASYYGLAGEQALNSFCISESIKYLTEALSLIEHMESNEQHWFRIRWLVTLGEAYKYKGAYSIAAVHFKSAIEFAGGSLYQGTAVNVKSSIRRLKEIAFLYLLEKKENHVDVYIVRNTLDEDMPGPAISFRVAQGLTQGTPNTQGITSEALPFENAYRSLPSTDLTSRQIEISSLMGKAYEMLSQIALGESNHSEVIFYAHEGLKICQLNELWGCKVRLYSILSQLASFKKQRAYSRLYISRVQRILARSHANGSMASDAAQAMMRLSVSNLFVGSTTVALMHCRQGVNYAKAGGDLVTQVKLLTTESLICLMKGDPTECIRNHAFLRDVVSSIGDVRYREWYLSQAAFLCARYGISSRYEIAAK
eukprot:TRINITY_DN6875_c0_g1_i7.p1 TRINITY_DN6875_c0_g1~~TRINITY_DN6875_c0_g1_i7.p1  ORF type:complete len:1378 (-),score=265.89 TRINITY_DN6875_c0_g1_i7:210-4343(-)